MTKLVAKDVMTRDVKTVEPHTTVREVAELLASAHISGVPVVDLEGRVIGMVSEADLLNEDKVQAAIPRTALFGIYPIPEETLLKAYQEGATVQAQQVMHRDVVTAEEETPISELARMMVQSEVNRIPILRDGKLVGIVTRADLLRALWDG
ncbi:MAG TPA: CBS domain-containing protein [Chthonomonadaceae bacterium]|nr:CBS domain-containing protein [Chthonomonadaceae bacterium]